MFSLVASFPIPGMLDVNRIIYDFLIKMDIRTYSYTQYPVLYKVLTSFTDDRYIEDVEYLCDNPVSFREQGYELNFEKMLDHDCFNLYKSHKTPMEYSPTKIDYLSRNCPRIVEDLIAPNFSLGNISTNPIINIATIDLLFRFVNQEDREILADHILYYWITESYNYTYMDTVKHLISEYQVPNSTITDMFQYCDQAFVDKILELESYQVDFSDVYSFEYSDDLILISLLNHPRYVSALTNFEIAFHLGHYGIARRYSKLIDPEEITRFTTENEYDIEFLDIGDSI
ncbi:MAG: hypothetical protein GY751_00280 [Bacteroidetes bacterium]|nr:hypothetical protein [Bacteroidota bacterium]